MYALFEGTRQIGDRFDTEKEVWEAALIEGLVTDVPVADADDSNILPNGHHVEQVELRDGPRSDLEDSRKIMPEYRDVQNGVNDPVNGLDVKHQRHENQTPHEREQGYADVRAPASPDASEPFLPEALRREPAGPLNPRTGRNPTK